MKREGLHLRVDRVGNLGLVVAQAHIANAGAAIQILIALRIPKIDPFACDNNGEISVGMILKGRKDRQLILAFQVS